MNNLSRKPFLKEPSSAWLLLILFCCGVLAGCGAFHRAAKTAKSVVTLDFDGSDDGPGKRLGAIHFNIARSPGTDAHSALLRDELLRAVQKEQPGVTIVAPGDDRFPQEVVDLLTPSKGRLDNLALAEYGRRAGLNAVLRSTLVDVSADREPRGLLFKDMEYAAKVFAFVEIYDAGTGAKRLDESVSDEIEIDETAYMMIRDGRPGDVSELEELVKDIAEKAGEKVCEALKRQPWQGYVDAVRDGKIFIKWGQDAGLKPGMTLHVYDLGKTVDGIGDQKFFVPGEKIGDIRITEIFAESAEAEAINDSGIVPGSPVRK